MEWMQRAASTAEQRLAQAGVQLTLGGEPTFVPDQPEGPEWTVAADGPTKLKLARAMAAAIQSRTWQGSTLLYCTGKRYEGEVNPRWAVRLVTGLDGAPIAAWPESGSGRSAEPLQPHQAQAWLHALGRALGTGLEPLLLQDPRQPDNHVWAVPLTWAEGGWLASPWPLAPDRRQLGLAPGPAGLRLPLEHFPADVPCQVLTLEISQDQWSLFLPPLERQPTEALLQAISSLALQPEWGSPLEPPLFSGVLPVDAFSGWQVLGLTADPGVLEINLPVCHSWDHYRHWLELLEEAAASVGLRTWRQRADGGQQGTGGGNHLLWGGPNLIQHPFFKRPAWLVGILRYFQHHPSLSYLFCGDGIGPSSQAPRADEALGSLVDLELAYRVLETAAAGDQRQLIGETLRHLHADRSGNNHRCEVSFDKFWSPDTPGGCQGLIEFRAIESLPRSDWTAAIALLWSCLAAALLDPVLRPTRLKDWGASLHDRMLLPSQLWSDLEAVLIDLANAGLVLEAEPFRQIWEWRFPVLLHWLDPATGAQLHVRHALETWPLICDTPREGGTTSRFVDASLRRFEVSVNQPFRQHFSLSLQERHLPLPDSIQPLAVRWRAHRLYPCLHPGIPPEQLLRIAVEPRDPAGGLRSRAWQLNPEGMACQDIPLGTEIPSIASSQPPGRAAWSCPWHADGSCTLDLRLAQVERSAS